MTEDDQRAGRTSVSRRSVLKAAGTGAVLPGLAANGHAAEGKTSGAVGTGVSDATDGLALANARNDWYSRRAVTSETECFQPNEREIYGPTDINAQSANGRLAVAVNGEGTMSIFRWPRPSFYDQLKYFTRGRTDENEIDVAPNHGAFLGLAIEGEDGFVTTWLRDWKATQRYANDDPDADAEFSDEVVTSYASDEHDFVVEVRDLVAHRDGESLDESAGQRDAFVRRVRVVHQGNPNDRPTVKFIAYENFNLVTTKHPQYPIHDWCVEENNDDRARYVADLDAVVHSRSGVDESTGELQRVAVAMGFDSQSTGHQVGGDAYEPLSPAGLAGPTRDAYNDASDGELTGNDEYVGQTTGALATELSFTGNRATERVVFAAAHTPETAGAFLERTRQRPFRELRREKQQWLEGLLGDAPLPDTENEDVLALCRRALVTLVTDYDPLNGAIVASIATQAPYGEDWIRDGAYFNYVLQLVGLHDWVGKRNRWYADIQQRVTDPRPTMAETPPGNWIMNYYGDGVAGGPIPYEIDETGYGIWTMWDHYTVIEGTDEAEAYLADVYPAIRRAGDYLVECRDPRNDLHCPAWEDDRFIPSQSIVGASLVWLGLDAAMRAANELERESDANRYRTRRDEIGRAIDQHLYDTEQGAYGITDDGIGFPMAEVVWPVCFTPYTDPETGDLHDKPQVENPFDHPRIQRHLNSVWETVSPAFEAPCPDCQKTGQYEVKGLISLVKARRYETSGEDVAGSLSDVRDGIDWIASRHATPDTHVMGEAWKVFDGESEVRSIISQPHAWEQVLTYMAALEAYPPADLEFEERTCGSVLEALRRRAAPTQSDEQ